MSNYTVVNAPFFLLRTPLLPFRIFTSWATPGTDDGSSRAWMRLKTYLLDTFAEDELREALFIASPSLHSRVTALGKVEESSLNKKVLLSLARYLSRATSRCTPFGLFAGVSLGHIASHTDLRVDSVVTCKAHARISAVARRALIHYIDPLSIDYIGICRFRRNDTITRVGDEVRFVKLDVARGLYSLFATPSTTLLTVVLEVTRVESTLENIVSQLSVYEPDYTKAELVEYVTCLVRSGVLRSDLDLAVTSHETDERERLHLMNDRLSSLRGVQQRLDNVSRRPVGKSLKEYGEALTSLEELLPETYANQLIHVDLMKPLGAVLEKSVVALISHSVAPLSMKDVRRRHAIDDFVDRFKARYGERVVRLSEVLDDDGGLGFGSMTSDVPSMLAHIKFAGAIPPSAGLATSAWDRLLCAAVVHAAEKKERVVTLKEEDLALLPDTDPLIVKKVLQTVITLSAASEAAVEQGDFEFFVQGFAGSSGVEMSTRFAMHDVELETQIQSFVTLSDDFDSEKIYAEVIHLPIGPLANVTVRPALRMFEIPYLGRSTLPDPRQIIYIDDLEVMIVNNRPILWSCLHNAEVVPRLSSAIDNTASDLPVYKFLLALQDYDRAGWWFEWPQALSNAHFLPRLAVGRMVISLATWKLGPDEVKSCLGACRARDLTSLAAIADRLNLPRYTRLGEKDKYVVVDMQNVLSVEAALEKATEGACLQEVFPDEANLIVKDKLGQSYFHEILIPFIVTRSGLRPDVQQRSLREKRLLLNNVTNRNCQSWLYLKIYCARRLADQVLEKLWLRLEAFFPVESLASFFFVRYTDPEFHIRFRMYIACPVDRARVDTAIQEYMSTQEMISLVWKTQRDSYFPEEWRYGGTEALTYTEEIFNADSKCVMSFLVRSRGLKCDERRWEAVVLGIDTFFSDARMNLQERLDVCARLALAYEAEQRLVPSSKKEIGSLFMQTRDTLLSSLLGSPMDSYLTIATECFLSRSPVVKKNFERLRQQEIEGKLTVSFDEVMQALLHMFACRMLPSNLRQQECVIYQVMVRLYRFRRAVAS